MKQSLFLLSCGILIGTVLYRYFDTSFSSSPSPRTAQEKIAHVTSCTASEVSNYQFNYHSFGALELKDKDEADQYNTRWSGILKSTCLSSNEDANHYYLELSIDQVEGNLPIPIEELSQGVYVSYSRDRLELASPRIQSLTSQNLWLDFASINFRCSSQNKQCQEYNPRGSYQAHYEAMTKGYKKTYQQSGLNQANYKYTIEVKHPQMTLQIEQHQKTPMLSYNGKTRIELSWMGRTQIPQDQLLTISKAQRIAKPMLLSINKEHSINQDTNVYHWDIDQIWAKENLDDLYPKIAKWLGSLDQVPEELIQKLEHSQDKNKQKLWVRILSKASTKHSQEVIRTFIEGRMDDPENFDLARYALIALGMCPNHFKESITFIKKLVNRDTVLQEQALYTLGIAASKNPMFQEQILHDLRQWLDTGSEKRQAVIIRSIGNTRIQKVYPILEPFLNSSKLSLKQDAIFAMRYDQQAFEALVTLLDSPEEAIAKQAIRSLRYQVTTDQKLEKMLQTWPRIDSQEVRLALLKSIVRYPQASERLLKRIKQFVDSEESEAFRAAAGKILKDSL